MHRNPLGPVFFPSLPDRGDIFYTQLDNRSPPTMTQIFVVMVDADGGILFQAGQPGEIGQLVKGDLYYWTPRGAKVSRNGGVTFDWHLGDVVIVAPDYQEYRMPSRWVSALEIAQSRGLVAATTGGDDHLRDAMVYALTSGKRVAMRDDDASYSRRHSPVVDCVERCASVCKVQRAVRTAIRPAGDLVAQRSELLHAALELEAIVRLEQNLSTAARFVLACRSVGDEVVGWRTMARVARAVAEQITDEIVGGG